MFKFFLRYQALFSTVRWSATAAAALLFNLWATQELNAAYAASGFPVPYWEAQLSFSHLKLKGWYQSLIEQGKLDLYLQAQYVDFLFIASVMLLHVAVLVVVSRMLPESSKSRLTVLWVALLSSLAPILDALENLVSFVMLAEPLAFEPVLAIAYSSLAAGKFAMFTVAYIAALLGVSWAVIVRIRRQHQRTGAALYLPPDGR